ncbi:hypothetical protein G9A89_005678 [Geosiphon pyriformis]|nr:hypothetical protein G9A89_005678 [Geosiphon pyriformis]
MDRVPISNGRFNPDLICFFTNDFTPKKRLKISPFPYNQRSHANNRNQRRRYQAILLLTDILLSIMMIIYRLLNVFSSVPTYDYADVFCTAFTVFNMTYFGLKIPTLFHNQTRSNLQFTKFSKDSGPKISPAAEAHFTTYSSSPSEPFKLPTNIENPIYKVNEKSHLKNEDRSSSSAQASAIKFMLNCVTKETQI